ncbi:MAG TPA: DUF2726 domain-containing protein [Planctomycetaceae bacterium]|nr:DUF2726 domain-containing protein [Planctomycetaceae bacterium]
MADSLENRKLPVYCRTEPNFLKAASMSPPFDELLPWIVLIGILLVVFFIAKLLLVEEEKLPYRKRSALVTETELAFFHRLREAVGGDWHVVAMVRLADLIRVKKGTNSFQTWQNKIHAKHIDFVLCDLETLSIELAIELDDSSHQRKDRIERDEFVDAALDSCQLPLLRVPVADGYNPKKLRAAIDDLLSRS